MPDAFASLAQLNFGEELVAELFRKIYAKESLVNNINEFKCYKKTSSGFVLSPIPFTEFTDVHAVNTPLYISLDSSTCLPMDGMHRVDVCLISNNKTKFPLEIKLGITGGAEKFPSTFISHWRHKDDELILYKLKEDGVGLFRGNMILTLDSDILFDSRNEKKVNYKKSIAIDNTMHELTHEWGLVIRENSVRDVKKNSLFPNNLPSNNFNNLQYVFILEELWKCLTPKGRESVEEKILILLKNEFTTLNTHCKC